MSDLEVALPLDIDLPPPPYEAEPDADTKRALVIKAQLEKVIAERETKKLEPTLTEKLRRMARSLEEVVAAPNPTTLQRARDEIESTKRACSDRIEGLDTIDQLQAERERIKAISESLLAAEQKKGVFEDEMVLVERDDI
ncbi:hypothetical protein VE03_10586 [Pseudogymnoascus sp. 23342-1-I1]|nr:hypothetical protein VE03_10586 [Pseudogymnoascus sp. 23342-1-I1]